MIELFPIAISLIVLAVAVGINSYRYMKESDYIKDKYRKQGAEEALRKLGIK